MTVSPLLRMPTSMNARDAMLSLLRTRFPFGVSSVELIDTYGPAAKTRIGELRRDGWDIDTSSVDGVACYTLRSLTKGGSDSTLAGCIIRLSERGWSARTHKDASLPEDVLARAEAAALAAYRAVLDAEGCVSAPDDRVDFFAFLDL